MGKPASQQLKKLPDHIKQGVKVLFVGINPGIRSAEVGHHFAGYSNRFWKLLYDSELIPVPLTYHDDWRLPEWGFGLTNIVSRATPGMHALTKEDYRQGKKRLVSKIRRYNPQIVALLGVTMYAVLFPTGPRPVSLKGRKSPKSQVGLLPQVLGGARVFLVPNPSGRNAHYSYHEMVGIFRKLQVLTQSTTRDIAPWRDPRQPMQGGRAQ